MAASGQLHQDSSIRMVLSGRPTFKKKLFVSNHLCLFFEFIQKGVSLFNIVFAMIIFYATIKFQ